MNIGTFYKLLYNNYLTDGELNNRILRNNVTTSSLLICLNNKTKV